MRLCEQQRRIEAVLRQDRLAFLREDKERELRRILEGEARIAPVS
jgi:hypothetical protein